MAALAGQAQPKLYASITVEPRQPLGPLVQGRRRTALWHPPRNPAELTAPIEEFRPPSFCAIDSIAQLNRAAPGRVRREVPGDLLAMPPCLRWSIPDSEMTKGVLNQKQQSRLRDQTYSEAPSGRKYCVPLTGSPRRRRSCWRSALRSTKSISEVLITSRSEEE
jgi:hypothetical protein